MSTNSVDMSRWRQIILRCHFIVAIIIFFVEVVANTMLYVYRLQGYSPDNIVSRLFRYLVLTSCINFGSFIISMVWSSKCDKSIQPYILFFGLSIVCIDVEFSHYQFAICFAMAVVPVFLTILYENYKLMCCVFFINFAGLILGVYSRATDSDYNADIVPEAIIAFAFLFSMHYFSKLILDIIISRQKAVEEMVTLRQKEKLLSEISKERKQFKQLSEETFVALSRAVDANDVYTSGHSQRVADYAKMIAEHMRFPVDKVWEIYYAGLLHDVGKIGIDNNIINKPDNLTKEEFDEIKRHPSIGYNILYGISIMGDFALGAKTHHERIDGRGYPEGLSGDDILLIGRIIAVADAYDAMTSSRSYRPLMQQSLVRQELVNGKGSQFDSKIADIMISIIDADVEYKLHQ